MNYTEEDVRNAFKAGLTKGNHKSYFDAPLDEDEYLAELKQVKNNIVLADVSGRSEQLNFKNKPEQDVEEDDLLNDCIEYAKAEGKIRRGTLQRKFKLGYLRAGRIMAQIEAKGILGEMTGRYDNDREVCF